MFWTLTTRSLTVWTTELQLCTWIPAWINGCEVSIVTDSTNSGIVYIGTTWLTAGTTTATDWFPRTADKGITLTVSDPLSIYVRASGAWQKVYFAVNYI